VKGHFRWTPARHRNAVTIVAEPPGMAAHLCCTKHMRPASRCEVCTPLFQTTRCARGCIPHPRCKRARGIRSRSGFVGQSVYWRRLGSSRELGPQGRLLHGYRRGRRRDVLCTCRAGTGSRSRRARTCSSRHPPASRKRLRPSASDLLP
jgi:hypothetical protein